MGSPTPAKVGGLSHEHFCQQAWATHSCGNVPPRSDELAKTREKLRPADADGAVVLGF